MTTTLQDLSVAIASGEFDTDLSHIHELVLNRQRDLRIAQIRASGLGAEGGFTPGQRVRLKSNLSPSYLQGAIGTLGVMKGTKWEWYPESGTRAFERSNGEAWRIRPHSIKEIVA